MEREKPWSLKRKTHLKDRKKKKKEKKEERNGNSLITRLAFNKLWQICTDGKQQICLPVHIQSTHHTSGSQTSLCRFGRNVSTLHIHKTSNHSNRTAGWAVLLFSGHSFLSGKLPECNGPWDVITFKQTPRIIWWGSGLPLTCQTSTKICIPIAKPRNMHTDSSAFEQKKKKVISQPFKCGHRSK